MSVPHSVPEGYDKVKHHHSRHCPKHSGNDISWPNKVYLQACFCTNFLVELKISLLIRRERSTSEHCPSLQHKTGCTDAVRLSKGLGHTLTLSPVKSFLKANVLLQGIAAPYPLRKAVVYKPQPSWLSAHVSRRRKSSVIAIPPIRLPHCVATRGFIFGFYINYANPTSPLLDGL